MLVHRFNGFKSSFQYVIFKGFNLVNRFGSKVFLPAGTSFGDTTGAWPRGLAGCGQCSGWGLPARFPRADSPSPHPEARKEPSAERSLRGGSRYMVTVKQKLLDLDLVLRFWETPLGSAANRKWQGKQAGSPLC